MMTLERFTHYKTGNEQMDNDHWVLLQLLGKVVALIRNAQYDAGIQHIKELLPMWETHTGHEVALMREVAYPYIAPHLEDHTAISNKLHYIVKSISKPQGSIVHYGIESFATGLEKQFVDHIDHHDIQITQWIKEHVGENK